MITRRRLYIFTMFNCVILLLIFLNYASPLCWYSRCCPDKDVVVDGLEKNLTSTLFGQPLVTDEIISVIGAHLSMQQPKKALVLSFHGPAGVGKTFVAKKIAHHLFNGENYHVKFYSGRNDFQEASNVEAHKERVAKEVSKTVQSCAHSVFIFDECNMMPDGLFDVLRPFTDYYEQYHGVDYRRSTFIFLSNIGASEIAKIYRNLKLSREALSVNHFFEAMTTFSYNQPGGMKKTSLISNFLIDSHIPFLPLEREHIEKCIASALIDEGLQSSQAHIRTVYDNLPKQRDGELEYVTSHCKKLHTEVAKIATRLSRDTRKKDEF